MNGSGLSNRMVKRVKFQKELPGLEAPPWPGELGQKIFENVSQQGWALWKEHAKMVLNEFRIAPWTKEGIEIMQDQTENFFSAKAPPFRPTTFLPRAARRGK